MKKLFPLIFLLSIVCGAPKVYSEGFISVTDAPSTPTASTLYKDNIVRAWVHFNGTSCSGGAGNNECTIAADFNVEKVIRISTGYYEVYFETDFSSANYVVSGTARAAYLELGDQYTNKVSFVTNYYSSGNRNDSVQVNIMAIGAQ